MNNSSAIAIVLFVCALILLIVMIRRKLVHGGSCCGEHAASESRIKVSDKNLSHYSYHYLAGIEGMVCSNCATRVENALNSKEGIYAKVDLGRKQSVIHAKRKIERKDVVTWLSGLPYTLTEFKSTE